MPAHVENIEPAFFHDRCYAIRTIGSRRPSIRFRDGGTRVASQPTMTVPRYFGKGPLLARSGHSCSLNPSQAHGIFVKYQINTQ
jgi:hypothetical protein